MTNEFFQRNANELNGNIRERGESEVSGFPALFYLYKPLSPPSHNLGFLLELAASPTKINFNWRWSRLSSWSSL